MANKHSTDQSSIIYLSLYVHGLVEQFHFSNHHHPPTANYCESEVQAELGSCNIQIKSNQHPCNIGELKDRAKLLYIHHKLHSAALFNSMGTRTNRFTFANVGGGVVVVEGGTKPRDAILLLHCILCGIDYLLENKFVRWLLTGRRRRRCRVSLVKRQSFQTKS